MRALTIVILSLILFSCSTSNEDELVVGKWKMLKILDSGRDITEQLNPMNDRWIEFKSDSSFSSGGGPYGDNNGVWWIDEDTGSLIMDSDEHNVNSEWNISVSGDTTTWNGVGDARQKQLQIILIRMN